MQLDHKHLVLRAEVTECPSQDSLNEVLNWMKELIVKIDMKLMQGPTISYVDQPGNRGTTCMALIETSHIVIHIWDEPVPALIQMDVYSCANFDPYKIANKIKEDFEIIKIDYKYLNRETGLKPIRLKK